MKILTILKASLSKAIQAIATSCTGVAVFVGFYYTFMSTAPYRYLIAGICVVVIIPSYFAYKLAVLKIYDDR